MNAALKDGVTLMEVEFPPLPTDVLDMDDIGAYQLARANFNFACDIARELRELNVTIMYPDQAELDISVDTVGTDRPYSNVKMDSL